MIPLKLALRNFMCYRDNVPPINFEGIRTACICGNNGNGKSALIDAMTWALWGETRAKSDDELVHAGRMDVEVEFIFAVESQRYRILRKHTKPKTLRSSGQTILEFQLITPEGNKTISGDTVTQTQQKIIRTLHMDYATFINSAFLKQGQANEFTKKRPGERKEVLANILQLEAYDELAEAARQITKGHQNTISLLETAIAGFQDELAAKAALQSEFDLAQNALLVAEKTAREQDQRLSTLRGDKERLENLKTRLVELEKHLGDTTRNLQEWNEQVTQCQNRVDVYEKLIAQRAVIEQNYNRFLDLKKQVQELDQKYKTVNSLTQTRHRLELAVIKAGEDLNRSHAVIESRINELQLVARTVPGIQEQINQAGLQLQALEQAETQIRTRQENSGNLKTKIHLLQEENARLVMDLAQIAEKLQMLSHSEGVQCPLCETELGSDGQHRLAAKYSAEKSAKTDALTNNRLELARLETALKTCDAEIADSDSGLKKERAGFQRRYGQLTQSLTDAREAGARIESEIQKRAEIEEKLARRDFALNEQAALTAVDEQVASLSYDPARHEILRGQLAECEQYESPKHRLAEADRLIVQEQAARAKACRMVDELRLEIASATLSRQNQRAEIEALPKVVAELKQAEDERHVLLANQRKFQGELGGIQARLERLASLEVRLKEKNNQLTEEVTQEKIHRDLAQAFGKNGLQAMLIEIAIPEIEMEADKLLARMTDNRMHIKMELQRETKKGDVAETLDINVSDELGTRNYEMFSGGEAFRIDFAIRIALSRLLARRAGAPLPTLIIDEGFGTQDTSGLEKIKEALTVIQDDFEKILVITHITDFKDSFPVHIEVVKTAEGSSISLN
jgi:DNA repair protein SbcC/Rad50